MFDKDRFKNATLITSDGRIRCCLCALMIEDKEEYLDGGEGNSAHTKCVEDLHLDNFPFDRQDTQANLDKADYLKPISLLATLSKIEVKSGGEKKIKLAFEIKITEALAGICSDLGIKAYDFLPGDEHKYSQANLESGSIYWDQWFLDWSKTEKIIVSERNRLVEVGHVGRFLSPKIITRDLGGHEATILVIQVQSWHSDIELLKSAYLDLGEVVSLKLRQYTRIDPQQELPLDEDTHGQEMSAEGVGMAEELDKKLDLEQDKVTVTQPVPGKSCKEPGCKTTKLYARGYCRKHWKKYVGVGSQTKMAKAA